MALSTGGTADDGRSEHQLSAAVEVMRAVRARCVWSRAITHDDLVPYLIEETHETIEAIETGDPDQMREELGDLLWQVLFHAQIASEAESGGFDIDDVGRGLVDKMVRRHPHVFADEQARTPEEVLVLWNAAKRAEKRNRRSVLEGVPRSMPSLALAEKLIARAAQLEVVPPSARSAMPVDEDELGDELLRLVALARARGWSAESALRRRLRAFEQEILAQESTPVGGEDADLEG